MLSVPSDASSSKYLRPQSPSISQTTLSSAASSREALLAVPSADIPLRSLTSSSSSGKLAVPERASSSNLSLPHCPGHSPTTPKKRSLQVDDHVIALAVTITLALLVVIGVPLGAVLPQKCVVPLPVNVLVPFYVNPVQDSWDRLFKAIIKHPETNFTVIVSVDHGPSSSAWPSGVYLNPIKRLNTLPNVQTIGYIDTAYGSRDGDKVRTEIATYAGWNNTEIPMSGIYFDHTPAKDVNDTRQYLRNVSATVRHSDGFRQPSIVVHNPGRVPDPSMTSYHADLTVVFEGEYSDMPMRNGTKTSLQGLSGRREDYAEIVHSVPRTISRGGIRKIINSARRDVGWLFVTDRMGDNMYEWYSDRWEEFLDLTF